MALLGESPVVKLVENAHVATQAVTSSLVSCILLKLRFLVYCYLELITRMTALQKLDIRSSKGFRLVVPMLP